MPLPPRQMQAQQLAQLQSNVTARAHALNMAHIHGGTAAQQAQARTHPLPPAAVLARPLLPPSTTLPALPRALALALPLQP